MEYLIEWHTVEDDKNSWSNELSCPPVSELLSIQSPHQAEGRQLQENVWGWRQCQE